MKRLSNEYGIPTGEIFKGESSWTINEYNLKPWYIVKIRINKINKFQQIPSVSYKDQNDLLVYTNEVPDGGIITYVNKITIEDYVQYQQIEYEILEGIYWNSSSFNVLGEKIEHLYRLRFIEKMKKNKPKADMLKLVMNSIYGKTCMKMSMESVRYKSHELGLSYFYENFGIIKDYCSNKVNTRIVERDLDDSFSLNYIGDAILSMSKRFMNEVFDIMNDENMPVYYTDTDSIHMNECDKTKLAEIYYQKYNRILLGEGLGQFSDDFVLENDENGYEVKCKDANDESNVKSIKFIGLAPKVYMDVLEGISDGEIVQNVHIRIKGVNESAINYEIKRRGLNRVEGCLSIFQDFIDGNPVEFILNPTEYDASFEYKNGIVYSRDIGEFKRVLTF
jgi:hypothetical protein